MNKWCFKAVIFALCVVSVINFVETRRTRARNACSWRCVRSCRERPHVSRRMDELNCERECKDFAITCVFCSHLGGRCRKCARGYRLVYGKRCIRASPVKHTRNTTSTTVSYEKITEVQPTTVGKPTTVAVEYTTRLIGQTTEGAAQPTTVGEATTVAVEYTTWLIGELIEQWVSGVDSYSSQWSTTLWSANEIIGPYNVYPNYGDLIHAWAPRGINTDDYIQVYFDVPVYATEINIYETNAAGGTTKVTLFDNRNNDSVVVWTNPSPQFLNFARILNITLSPQNFPTKMMRIDVTSVSTGTWAELDAVKLYGYKR